MTAPALNENPAGASSPPLAVPPADVWDAIRPCILRYLECKPLTPPLTLEQLRNTADNFLQSAPFDSQYRDFLMVQLHNAIWQPVVESIPMERRILMLPPCLRSSKECPATADAYGLVCARCGRCCLGDLSTEAESLGYAVLIVESTRVIEPFLARGEADAIIGVGCMPALERSFHFLVNSGTPGLAIPLLRDGCRDTHVSMAHLQSLIRSHRTDSAGFPDYHAIRRKVDAWFQPNALRQLLPESSSGTEDATLEWLAFSGKRWRPFLTAATYSAITGCQPDAFPVSLRNISIAVECLHKASLIFDDIQDNDNVRYGRETFHRQHGIPLATTAGLHLLGLGYRLIATSGAAPETVAAMTDITSHAHLELCRGQGAELWAVHHQRLLTPEEILRIFRLKTSPAFTVGLSMGAILAGNPGLSGLLQAFGDALGTAYQIQDDLQDWRTQGQTEDFQTLCPSYVTALASAHAPAPLRDRIAKAFDSNSPGKAALLREAAIATNSESLARTHLSEFRLMALQALQPLENRNLKILLHRFLAQAVPPPAQP